MQVKTVMTTPAITVKAGATLYEALDLLVHHRMSGLPVVDEAEQLCGILSERDVLRRVELGTSELRRSWWSRLLSGVGADEAYCVANGRRVEDVMSRSPVTIDENASLAEAVAEMEGHGFKRLPVTRDGDLVGMLTRADLVRALRAALAPAYEEPATSDDEIRTRILNELRAQPWAADGMVEVAVKDGCVTLDGTVARDALRRAAGVAAETVVGVRQIDNRIEVVDGIVMPPL